MPFFLLYEQQEEKTSICLERFVQNPVRYGIEVRHLRYQVHSIHGKKTKIINGLIMMKIQRLHMMRMRQLLLKRFILTLAMSWLMITGDWNQKLPYRMEPIWHLQKKIIMIMPMMLVEKM